MLFFTVVPGHMHGTRRDGRRGRRAQCTGEFFPAQKHIGSPAVGTQFRFSCRGQKVRACKTRGKHRRKAGGKCRLRLRNGGVGEGKIFMRGLAVLVEDLHLQTKPVLHPAKPSDSLFFTGNPGFGQDQFQEGPVLRGRKKERKERRARALSGAVIGHHVSCRPPERALFLSCGRNSSCFRCGS